MKRLAERGWKFAVRHVLTAWLRLGRATGWLARRQARIRRRVERAYAAAGAGTDLPLPAPAPPDWRQLAYASVSYKPPQFWEQTYIMQDGIPLVQYAGAAEPRRNYVTAAQYALSCFDHGRPEAGLALAAWLRQEAEWLPEGGAAYPFGFDWPMYGLRAPWYSALAQAQVMSVCFRAWSLSGDRSWLDHAEAAGAVMIRPAEAGGLLRHTPEGLVWLEEYPGAQPVLVLNGFVSAVIALLEARFTGPQPPAREALAADALRSLKRSFSAYDTGFWLRYDRVSPKHITPEYMKFQALQLDQLAALTGDPFFPRTAARLRRYYRRRRWLPLYDFDLLKAVTGVRI